MVSEREVVRLVVLISDREVGRTGSRDCRGWGLGARITLGMGGDFVLVLFS
jgi:hypothetical protein